MKPDLKLVPRRKLPIDWRNILAWGGGILFSALCWFVLIYVLTK